MQSNADTAGRSRSGAQYAPLEEYVWSKIEQLQARYIAQVQGSAASLARLRRNVTSEPGSDPLIWEETLAGLPLKYVGRDDAPTEVERAVHVAIALFALHQQSHFTFRAHQRGPSFGRASSRLAIDERTSEPAVLRRFQALATASSLSETLVHARGLITQFRSAKVALDYGRFAADLAKLQRPVSANGVRLAWGRDYYYRPKTEKTTTELNGEHK